MKNIGMFFAVAALLGAAAAFQSFAIMMIVLCFMIVFLWKRKKFPLMHLLIVFLLFFLFFIRTEKVIFSNVTSLSGEEQHFQLLFNEIGRIDGDVFTISVVERQYDERLQIRYRIQSEQEKKYLQREISPGLICKINGKLVEPSPSTNENAFDYKDYLERNKIHWILEPNRLTVESCQKTGGILTTIKKIRAQGIKYLEINFPPDTVPLAAALLFGTSDLIQSETMDDYRELGIVHLLAISGLHITIVVAIVYFLLLRIGMTRENSIVLLLVCLPVYCISAGASPSVNRSVLMTMLLLLMRRWGKNHLNILDLISFTFLLYLFLSPYSIFNIGFLLSFLVTFTLILSSPYILSRYDHPVSLLLSTSFISMICSAPMLLYFFFEFSIISVMVNLLYIPLFNFVLLPYILFIFVFHLLFGEFMNPFLYPLNEMIKIMDDFTAKLANLPWNTVILGVPEVPFLLLYGWGILLFFAMWEKGVKGNGRWIMLLPCFLFAGQYLSMNYSLEGEVTFLDVGQGDCIFIKLPLSKGNYLIDTGGNIMFEQESWQVKDNQYEVGEDTVVPFLKSKGVTTIDKLIITHGDMDHSGGAEAVLRELNVEELILPDAKEKNKIEQKLENFALTKGIKTVFVHEGDSWKTGEYRFQILSPEMNSSSESNNSSIVLYTKLGGLTWLFTGDLEAEGEEKLLNQYQSVSADVLKIGHHGSKSSTTEAFLDGVSPKIAIISVGENNRYHHPHQEVIKRLENRKIKIFRTDLSGAITYTFQKEAGTFSVQNP